MTHGRIRLADHALAPLSAPPALACASTARVATAVSHVSPSRAYPTSVDGGADFAAVTKDLDGSTRPAGSAYDRGAHERAVPAATEPMSVGGRQQATGAETGSNATPASPGSSTAPAARGAGVIAAGTGLLLVVRHVRAGRSGERG